VVLQVKNPASVCKTDVVFFIFLFVVLMFLLRIYGPARLASPYRARVYTNRARFVHALLWDGKSHSVPQIPSTNNSLPFMGPVVGPF